MITTDDLARLARLSAELRPYISSQAGPCTYEHMGATLSDAMLQSALNYRTVVQPRVERLMGLWTSATTASRFLDRIENHGLERVLNWHSPVKLQRIHQLTIFCVERGFETEADLRAWLLSEGNPPELMALPGMGPKTSDYLRKLVGLSTIPVDRHMTRFLERAGLECDGYQERQQALIAFACCLGIDPGVLDDAVWQLQSEKHRGGGRLDSMRTSTA